jgi:hypothetical protein
MDRIGNDSTDQSQKNLYNTRFGNYTLSNYFSETVSDSHVQFALNQPTINFSGMAYGQGLNGAVVDTESKLYIDSVEEERSVGRVQLFERPFLTVPYLGRGSADPSIESRLQQGELVAQKKSVSTIMEKSFTQYSLYPTDANMEERVKNPSYTVEESALNGWVRGGAATRDMAADPYLKNQNRPNASF